MREARRRERRERIVRAVQQLVAVLQLEELERKSVARGGQVDGIDDEWRPEPSPMPALHVRAERPKIGRLDAVEQQHGVQRRDERTVGVGRRLAVEGERAHPRAEETAAIGAKRVERGGVAGVEGHRRRER